MPEASLTSGAIANSASTNILAIDTLQKSIDDVEAEINKFAWDTQSYIDTLTLIVGSCILGSKPGSDFLVFAATS